MFPLDHVAARVMQTAATHPTTWTAATAAEIDGLGISRPASWAEGRVDVRVKASRKRWARRYMCEVACPRLAQVERDWLDAQAATWAQNGALTIASIDGSAWPSSALRAWAQLRLQGRLTLPCAGSAEKAPCPACASTIGPELRHLVSTCPGSRDAWRACIADTEWSVLPAPDVVRRFLQPQEADDVLCAIRLAGALQARVKAAWASESEAKEVRETVAFT